MKPLASFSKTFTKFESEMTKHGILDGYFFIYTNLKHLLLFWKKKLGLFYNL